MSSVIVKATDTIHWAGSSYGAAVALTGISNAAEAVVTKVAHGLTDLSAVRIKSVVGMDGINGLIVPIDVLTTDTFKLIGFDTLNMSAYVSGGTFEPVVFTNFCELTGFSSSTGSTPENNRTRWCDPFSVYDFGKPDPGSFNINFDHAPTVTVDAIDAAGKTAGFMVFKTTYKTYPFATFEIGTVTQTSKNLSDPVNGSWEGTATVRRRFYPIKVTATP
jgi:hypothetical protein